jgi:hypothetical protein
MACGVRSVALTPLRWSPANADTGAGRTGFQRRSAGATAAGEASNIDPSVIRAVQFAAFPAGAGRPAIGQSNLVKITAIGRDPNLLVVSR